MNNLSGANPAKWIKKDDKVEVIAERNNKAPVNLTAESDEIKQLQNKIMRKYVEYPSKNIYDCIILLESASKSLLN